MIGTCAILLPRITVPDSEAKKKDDVPKKVVFARFEGHSKPSTVGGVCWTCGLIQAGGELG